jgi:hypothetical protein
MRVRHGCLVGTLLATFLTAAPASAQPIEPLGPQLRLTQPHATTPDIAYNSVRDEYLVVWRHTAGEIWARRLHSDGSPAGEPFQVSPGGASSPNVAYDPERDRYGVAYRRLTAGYEVFVQRISGDGRSIWPNGDPGGPPTQASLTPGGGANDAEIVYRPDANGDSTPGDRWIVAYNSSANDEIHLSAVEADTNNAVVDRQVSAMPAAGTAWFPSLAVVSGTDDLLVAWEGFDGVASSEIWVNRVAGDLPALDAGQVPVTTSGGTAFLPSIAADPDTNRFLIAYRARETAAEGTEIHVQRIDAGLGQVGTDDQQVSSAGPAGSGSTYAVDAPNAGYHPVLRRYLVTWSGNDDGRPEYTNGETELSGTVLDANGGEGEPQDFPISRMGSPGNLHVDFQDSAIAAPGARRWLAIWSSDDPQPPLGDDQFAAYGRFVGEVPPETSAAPAAAPATTAARLVRRFRVRDTHTRVKRLAVVGAKPGTRVVLRCRGGGCPRRVAVTGGGTINLKRYVRRARLRPGAVLVIRILEPGAIGRVERFRIRDDRAPLRRPSAAP